MTLKQNVSINVCIRYLKHVQGKHKGYVQKYYGWKQVLYDPPYCLSLTLKPSKNPKGGIRNHIPLLQHWEAAYTYHHVKYLYKILLVIQ